MGRKVAAAACWWWGGNWEWGGNQNEQVELVGVFWASPECSRPWFQARLAQMLASVSFWLITEQAKYPEIDLGVTSCQPGMGEIMAQKAQGTCGKGQYQVGCAITSARVFGASLGEIPY